MSTSSNPNWFLAFTFSGIMLFAVALILTPRFSYGLIILFALGVLFSRFAQQRFAQKPFFQNLFTLNTLTLSFIAFCTYLLINSLWSVDPITAYGKALLFIVVVAICFLTWRNSTLAHSALHRASSHALILGTFIGGSILLIEFLTDQMIVRFIFNHTDLLRPASNKHFVMDGDKIIGVSIHTLNRSAANFMLLFWPCMLAIYMTIQHKWRHWLALALTLIMALCAAHTQHAATVVAFAGSLFIFLLAHLSITLTRWSAIAGWAAIVSLIVPLALLMHHFELHKADWLMTSARARVILWDYTATQVIKKPILGVGLRSTKQLDDAHFKKLKQTPLQKGQIYYRRTGRHSHNIFMQTWYELGAIGAGLLLLCGLALLQSLWRLPIKMRRYGFPAFVAATAIMCFSWGMWQIWYFAALGLSFCLFTMVAHAPQAQPDEKRADREGA